MTTSNKTSDSPRAPSKSQPAPRSIIVATAVFCAATFATPSGARQTLPPRPAPPPPPPAPTEIVVGDCARKNETKAESLMEAVKKSRPGGVVKLCPRETIVHHVRELTLDKPLSILSYDPGRPARVEVLGEDFCIRFAPKSGEAANFLVENVEIVSINAKRGACLSVNSEAVVAFGGYVTVDVTSGGSGIEVSNNASLRVGERTDAGPTLEILGNGAGDFGVKVHAGARVSLLDGSIAGFSTGVESYGETTFVGDDVYIDDVAVGFRFGGVRVKGDRQLSEISAKIKARSSAVQIDKSFYGDAVLNRVEITQIPTSDKSKACANSAFSGVSIDAPKAGLKIINSTIRPCSSAGKRSIGVDAASAESLLLQQNRISGHVAVRTGKVLDLDIVSNDLSDAKKAVSMDDTEFRHCLRGENTFRSGQRVKMQKVLNRSGCRQHGQISFLTDKSK